MPNRNVILAIDEGTSGTRAAVVASDGHVSCLEYTALQVDSPRPGVVEQDANVLLERRSTSAAPRWRRPLARISTSWRWRSRHSAPLACCGTP